MVTELTTLRRALAGLVALCFSLLVTLQPGVAAAQEKTDGYTTAASSEDSSTPDVREDLALDIEGASIDEVRAQKAQLETERATAQRRLRDAETVQGKAVERLADAEIERHRAQNLADFWDEAVRMAMVDAYVDGDGGSDVSYILADDIYDQSRRTAYYEYEADRRYDILKEKDRAHRNLAAAVTSKALVAEEADQARERAESTLAALDDALARQAVLVDNVEQRYESALAEAEALAGANYDQTASELLSAEQELHDEVVTSTATSGPAALAVDGSSAVPAAPASNAPPSASRPRPTPTTSAPAPIAPSRPVPTLPSVSTVWVRGIEVAPSIAPNVEAMMGAASAEGLRISGSGFRDPQRQIQLRMAHCGASRFAIYEMRASDCSPPTAVPGRSMHERGLALDLTCSGVLIRSRDNPCYRWLAANASRHGLYNLPSEPWHWSTNGN